VNAGSREAVCDRCGRPNVLCWHAPSPLWNAVLRDPESGRDEWEILCPVCFAELARAKGFDGVWHWQIDGLDLGSLWEFDAGYVWDAARCQWVED
jgi:hypothetical protein